MCRRDTGTQVARKDSNLKDVATDIGKAVNQRRRPLARRQQDALGNHTRDGWKESEEVSYLLGDCDPLPKAQLLAGSSSQLHCLGVFVCLFGFICLFLCFVSMVLGVEPGALKVLGEHSTTKLHSLTSNLCILANSWSSGPRLVTAL